MAGACGNPAILAYANKLTPTDEPDVGYAMMPMLTRRSMSTSFDWMLRRFPGSM